ncbi:TetR/AcrR family transcriptional regulator [soil metagenome]
MARTRNSLETRTKLIEAARDLIRAKGYSATTVDDICHSAGVTKGGFFHHFESKDQLGVAAAEHFSAMAEQLFATAPYCALQDPRDRLFGYIDFRTAMFGYEIAQYTCLLGTMVQEAYSTHPNVREACAAGMTTHVEDLARDIEAAKQLYAPSASWTSESVGYFIQAVLQGAFIFAKAKQGPEVALESMMHLRRYLETLFYPI